ncbi:cytochrome P450 76T24-like [Cicer arietinum]|uniref:Geraniol 8-hydroxylase-like n=1 Tax=Cicer arietinum TaxID=3827 RepID=A0A1S2YM06_CICAR|nr:geraniol 8-hydroxylase-like [Cicer arietinum]
MDFIKVVPLISFLYACIHIIAFGLLCKNKKSPKLPPGPPSYPLIGNILQLGPSKLHQSLTKLSKTYGPIMRVTIGTITTIVISSPKIAKEALHKNDQALSNRFIPESVQALSHDKSSLIFMPISPKWKTLRKICATKIFSSQQLDSTQSLRLEKLKELVVYLKENCEKGKAIDIGEVAFTISLNSISNTLFSIDMASFASSSSQNFRDVISSMLIEASNPNIADYYPILRRIDPQGSQRRMKNYYQKLLTLFESIIEDRSNQRKDCVMEGSDVLDLFLNMIRNENSELTKHDLLHLFLDLFIAGTDTTSVTIEWTMAELLQNPEKLKKTRKELQKVINKDEGVKDLDITNLPYLQAVVKETLRLHPSAPILVHKSVSEVELCGFKVPKDAQVLVNVWSMGRDSSIWNDPNLFVPERFLESGDVFREEDFGFIPFGAGRRMCPGVSFAHRVVHTMLATMLYHFDWKLVDEEKCEDIDMTENFGVTLHKIKPLIAIPIKEELENSYIV